MFENLKTWFRNLFASKCEHDFKLAYSRVLRDQYDTEYIEYSVVCKKCGREIRRYIDADQEYPADVVESAANHNRPIGSIIRW